MYLKKLMFIIINSKMWVYSNISLYRGKITIAYSKSLVFAILSKSELFYIEFN